jgi:hypothetical protein
VLVSSVIFKGLLSSRDIAIPAQDARTHQDNNNKTNVSSTVLGSSPAFIASVEPFASDVM